MGSSVLASTMNLIQCRQNFEAVRAELSKVIVGHAEALEQLLVAVCCGGHVMLSGVPGLGRTLLVKSLAKVLGLSFRRIQFTPDLLPTDIIGTEVLQESTDRRSRSFRFFQGPVFANLVLADEINRSPPRTQAALLEVMQERQVTVGGTKHPVPAPFLLIATENSLETEGIFPLPEAQMDRFMMAIHLDYPSPDEESAIIDAATGTSAPQAAQVLEPETLIEMQHVARAIPVVPSVKQYALMLVRNSRPSKNAARSKGGAAEEVGKLLRWGASPRAGQSLIAGAKILACVRGRAYVTRQDVRDVALPTFAHRLIPSFRAGAEGVSAGELVRRLIDATDKQTAPAVTSRRWRDILLSK
jgi:MoxR-like ATPase